MREFKTKLYLWFRFFILSKKVWRRPKNSDVLVYDITGYELFSNYLSPWTCEILYVHGESLNIWVLVNCLFRRRLSMDDYVDLYIEKVQPRLIITFIDNDIRFMALSARHKGVKTAFIQNGYRNFHGDIFERLSKRSDAEPPLMVDYMATFGACIGREFKKYIGGNAIPCGSLKNNRVPKSTRRMSDSIAYISQFRDTQGIDQGEYYFTHEEFFVSSDRLVLSCLSNYAEENGKELIIIQKFSLDPEKIENEQSYFRRLTDGICRFSLSRSHEDSYLAIDAAEVVVSIDSTLGFESAVRGNKTAIFSIRNNLLGVSDRKFGWPAPYPDDGPFWTNHADPKNFENILNHLFSINEDQWQEELEYSDFFQLMRFDPGNSTLRKLFHQVLGPLPKGRDQR